MLCDLGCCIVFVHPGIELLDTLMFQFSLQPIWLAEIPTERGTYDLCIIIICHPKHSNRLVIISERMVLVCLQVELLSLGSGTRLLLHGVHALLCSKCCCASSTSRCFLWEFLSCIELACLLYERSDCGCEGLCGCLKDVQCAVCVNV